MTSLDGLPPQVRAHVAVALRDHVRRLRRDGYPVPPEVAALAAALLRPAVNRDPNRERREAELRAQVFGHYGGACACCGSTEFLTIDHVNGDGRAHREELFGRGRTGGYGVYRWLIKNDFPEGFQTLCHSCNSSKQDGPRCRIDHAAAARMARSRARRRGEDIPLRRPGRPPKTQPQPQRLAL